MSTPTRTLGSVEFDTNPDSEKSHFSKTHGKYLTHLKMIKCPKIKNSELLDGINQISRSIEGCIKLTEMALGTPKSQNPKVLNPPQKRSRDILSGIDQVDSKLIDCINIAESTLQNKGHKTGGGICGGSGETNPACSVGTVYLQDTSEPFTETCPHSDSRTSQVLIRSGL